MMEIPEKLNIASFFIDRNIENGFGDEIAIIEEDGSSLTYRNLQTLVNKTGNGLRELGVEPENRVVIILPDGAEFVASFFGAVKIGAVPVPVNTLAKAAEYLYYLNDSQAKVLIVHEACVGEIESIRNDATYLNHLVVVGTSKSNQISFEALIGKASPGLDAADTTKDDIAFWLYTSGSGGQPKGVVHLQHDMIYTSELFGKGILAIDRNDITFSASKLFFAYGLGNAMSFPFSVGATTILYPARPKPEKVFEIIDKFHPTLFFGVPTLYAAMLQVEDAEKKYDLTSLRLASSAGEALPAALYHRFKDKFGVDILDGIGSTEMLHTFIANRLGDIRPGSSGQLVPGYEACIVDEHGQPAPDGEIGNLWIKGDSAAAGYWNKHEQTKKTFVGEWVVTGDKYYKDAEGYFYYCGRTDDMLKVAGMWVSPIEIEATLIKHPSVLECAVVGCKGGDGLVKPKAYLVIKEGHRGLESLTQDLKTFVRGNLTAYKCPRWIEFVDELPKTPTGKIQRFKLRA